MGPPLQIWSHVKANEIPKFRFLTQPLLSQESFSKAPSESNSCFMTFSLKKKKKSGFNRRNITVVIDVSFLLGTSFLVFMLQELEVQYVSVLSVITAGCINS